MSYSWGDDGYGASSGGKASKGFDYASARGAYAKEEPKERVKDYRSKIGATPAPVGKDISTDSTHPIVIATDVTGSMSDRPGIIFEKCPLLGKEVERYAPDYSISFIAFGDAYCDSHPLQVRDFDKGEALDAHIKGLYPEGRGGDAPESHDIVAYYYLNHCKIEKATKPIFIYITDVNSHTNLKKEAIKKWIGDDAQEDLDSLDLLKKLGEKFSVYVILSGGEGYKGFWDEIYGAQKVKVMSEARDIVEFIIGIIAGELGEGKDFEMRSSKRHSDRPDRVDRVMKSLRLDDAEVDPETEGKAKSSKSTKSSMKSKKLV